VTKPPYRVPSMAEVAAVPWNGRSVVTTFAGCGGSSLGYRMAGFRVLWANEFVPAAREVYGLNARPGTIMDDRDVREVDPASILAAIGLKAGQLDLLDGSPPCASFSTAGRRNVHWGKRRKYSDTKQRTDDLFFEYARLLRGLLPKVFVAENVSGLVKGVAKGYFLEVLAALKEPGYRVRAQVLDAQWLGVPQTRQRVIFLGVREDLGLEPVYPTPLPYRYSVRDALPWVEHLAHDTSNGPNTTFSVGDVTNKPCPAITVGVNSVNAQHYKVTRTPGDITGYAIAEAAKHIVAGQISKKYPNLIRAPVHSPCNTITAEGGRPSIASVIHPTERRKFTIAELKRICAFPDDFQLTGTYAQQWERLGRAVPPLMMRAIAETLRDQVFAKLKEERRVRDGRVVRHGHEPVRRVRSSRAASPPGA
jgi:DNA (cytosine-5)-methyltransferase 1